MNDAIYEISENAAMKDVVKTIIYSDEDNNEEHTLSIIGNSIYGIKNSSLIVNSGLNYENQKMYLLSVVISDKGGLKDTAEIIVNVLDEVESNSPLPVNKVMSPNNDGKNDYFVIDNVEIYKDYSLKIFNNASLVIYEVQSNYDNSWGGTFNGELVGKGVYYYLLQSNSDATKYFKGSISILK